MKRHLYAVAITLTLAVSGVAVAGDIYKWVDEDGNVHYGDKPVSNGSERVAIESRPTDRARVQSQYQAAAQARIENRDARAQADEEGRKAEEELRAQADERRQKCEASRATMQKFVTSRRIYTQDESGERVYMDDAQMQAARERVENDINEYCNNS
jgi:uncharacterized lipoprotein NlpE involved in copper resistance